MRNCVNSVNMCALENNSGYLIIKPRNTKIGVCVSKWIGLGLNPNKTQMLYVSRRHNKNKLKQEIEMEIKMNQKNFKFNTEMKCLGIILDINLNYNRHVEFIANRKN